MVSSVLSARQDQLPSLQKRNDARYIPRVSPVVKLVGNRARHHQAQKERSDHHATAGRRKSSPNDQIVKTEKPQEGGDCRATIHVDPVVVEHRLRLVVMFAK